MGRNSLRKKIMPKKDVCYITTGNLEPKYLKGEIISIKEPNSEWTEIETGVKNPNNPNMRFAVRTMVIAKPKLEDPLLKDSRLVIIKRNGRNYVDMVPKYIPGE